MSGVGDSNKLSKGEDDETDKQSRKRDEDNSPFDDGRYWSHNGHPSGQRLGEKGSYPNPHVRR